MKIGKQNSRTVSLSQPSLLKEIGDMAIGRKLATKFALAIFGAAGFSTPAYAVNFYNTYQPGMSQEQIKGVELATGILSKYLSDNIDIHIHFEMTTTDLPSGVIGESTSRMKKINYDKLKSGLQNDANNGGYDLYLPDSSQGSNYFSMRLQNGSYYHQAYEVLSMSANNKALGNDISVNDTNLDIHVLLDGSTNWYYNYDGGIDGNKYDFVGVVLHELAHGLGLGSTLSFEQGIPSGNNGKTLPSIWDMFRYTEQSATQGAIDHALGGQPYFSIDGGQSPFWMERYHDGVIDPEEQAYLSTGDPNYGGNGFGASHWQPLNDPLGIMNPNLKKGTHSALSGFDLTALDYIGYNVNHNAAIDLNQLKSEAQGRANRATIQNRSVDVYNLHAYNDSLNLRYSSWWQTDGSQSVPEPNTTKGLFAFVGAMGLFLMFKGKK
jgi:hypothetical protein